MPATFSRASATLVVVMISMLGCTRQTSQVAAPPAAAPAVDPHAAAQAAWTQFANAFVESYFKAHPTFAVQAGRHEYDGRMDDWSAASFQQESGRLKKLRADAQAMDDSALLPAQRFEREYLLSVIDRDLFWADEARAPFRNPAWYIDALDPDVYLSRQYAPLEVRLKAYIGYARSIPKLAEQIRANLATPMARPLIERGIDGFRGYAQFYRQDVPKVFAEVKDADAQSQLRDADEAAAKAMDGLSSWLVAQRKQANASFALGADLFAAMLEKTERVSVPLADLERIGRSDLDRNRQALESACAQYLPHASVRACISKMSADKPTSTVLEAARGMLTDLRAYIVRKDIVSIPSAEQAQVAEAPPYNRSNFAYINIPGPYDKGVAYVYNIAPPDPHWSAKERAEYIPGIAPLTFTSVHEVWPGHFLQFLHSNRNPSKIAALWVGYAYAEGWAHYCEEMMWDEGYGDGKPEMHIGQLTEALLRDVRFLSAIGLHTRGMSVEQSEKMFLEDAYQDPGNARQQAARGAYDPAYLNYTLGKLMIRKLRDDWVALESTQQGESGAADPKARWKAFHDAFLSYGGPPIPLVRQAMLGDQGSLL